MKFRFLFLFGLLILSFGSLAQHVNRYCNSAFTFCLDVPGNFNRAGESTTGQGHLFKSKDGSLLSVYGMFNTENETLQQRLEREQTALAADTSISNFTQMPTLGEAIMQENSFTMQYQNQNFTFLIFRKLEDNNWLSLELKFPTAKTKEYEAKMQRMIKSFN